MFATRAGPPRVCNIRRLDPGGPKGSANSPAPRYPAPKKRTPKTKHARPPTGKGINPKLRVRGGDPLGARVPLADDDPDPRLRDCSSA